MKKILSSILIALMALLVMGLGVGLAAEFPTSGLAIPFSATATTGTALPAGGIDVGFLTDRITCVMVRTGTAPTSADFILTGSLDNTTYYPIGATHTYTEGTATTYSIKFNRLEQFRYYKLEYDSRTGGDDTTKFATQCQAGGN